jgi:hypothetical protein
MAKRMSDTEKWKKPFIKGLPPEYKLLWLYILDECNIAGIWEAEFEIAQIRLGVQLSPEKALRLYKDKVVAVDNGSKWFILGFIAFQYGELTPKNKMYNSIVSILFKSKIEKAKWGINAPSDGAKDKVKDIIKDKDSVRDYTERAQGNLGSAPHNLQVPPVEPLMSLPECYDDYFMTGEHAASREQLCIANHMAMDELKGKATQFNAYLIGKSKLQWQISEWISYFGNWIPKNKARNGGGKPSPNNPHGLSDRQLNEIFG